MGYTFRADGVLGQVAIYENTDDAPWSDPLSHKSRVAFHSGLHYPARVGTLAGSLSLPARSAGPHTIGTQQYTLGAHGQTFIPMMEGRWIGVPGAAGDVPAVGSVPVQKYNNPVDQSFPEVFAVTRWLTLSADATNIYAHEMYPQEFDQPLGALTLNYEVHIIETPNLGGASTPPARTINWAPSVFEARTADGNSSFSSAKRYLKTAASGGFALASGQTVLIQYAFLNNNAQSVTYHFNMPGILEREYTSFGGQSFDPGTPSPGMQQVTI